MKGRETEEEIREYWRPDYVGLVSHRKAFGFSLSEMRGSHWRVLYRRLTRSDLYFKESF